MRDLTKARDEYAAQRPLFHRLAEIVGKRLELEAVARGLTYDVSYRAKTEESLLKKVFVENRPVSEVIDRAGARAIVQCSADLPAIHALVNETFEVDKRIDMLDAAADREFAYRGVHYHIRLKTANADASEAEVAELPCELQIHTRTQALWAAVSHQLAYKLEVDDRVLNRGLARLSALFELADEEIGRIRSELYTDQRFVPARVLSVLEPAYILLSNRDYNRKLSLVAIKGLAWIAKEFEKWRTEFSSFITANEGALRDIYIKYRTDFRNPLLHQPEALLVVFGLQNHRLSMRPRWPADISTEYLESFEAIWPEL